MDMDMQRLNPPGIFAHPEFTRIITVSGPAKIVWISGQTPQNSDLSCVAPGDYQAQYIDIMNKLAVQLKAIGATWNDVTFRRTYTTSIPKLRAAMALPSTPKFFDKPPCSTLIGVTELADPDFLLEIEIMAAIAP
jgi:enamine deaminase RidA (YjgF/YER057c/UK114 family)